MLPLPMQQRAQGILSRARARAQRAGPMLPNSALFRAQLDAATIQPLVHLAHWSAFSEVLVDVASTFSALAEVEANLPVMHAAGAAEAQLALLARAQRKERDAPDALVVKHAACALSRMLALERVQEEVAGSAEFLATVLRLADTPAGEVHRSAAVALWHLCRNERTKQAVTAQGGARILAMLANSSDDTVRRRSLAALLSLARSAATRRALAQPHVLQLLLHRAVSLPVTDAPCREAMVDMLWLLTHDAPARLALAEAGITAALRHFLQPSASTAHTLSRLCSCLLHLAEEPALHVELVIGGSVMCMLDAAMLHVHSLNAAVAVRKPEPAPVSSSKPATEEGTASVHGLIAANRRDELNSSRGLQVLPTTRRTGGRLASPVPRKRRNRKRRNKRVRARSSSSRPGPPAGRDGLAARMSGAVSRSTSRAPLPAEPAPRSWWEPPRPTPSLFADAGASSPRVASRLLVPLMQGGYAVTSPQRPATPRPHSARAATSTSTPCPTSPPHRPGRTIRSWSFRQAAAPPVTSTAPAAPASRAACVVTAPSPATTLPPSSPLTARHGGPSRAQLARLLPECRKLCMRVLLLLASTNGAATALADAGTCAVRTYLNSPAPSLLLRRPYSTDCVCLPVVCSGSAHQASLRSATLRPVLAVQYWMQTCRQ